MATEPHNPHDLFFKQYLSHPAIELVDIALEVIMLSDFRMRLQGLLVEAATETHIA